MSKTIEIADGKYAFELDENNNIRGMLHHGEPWPAGLELFKFNNCVNALVRELVDAREDPNPRCASCGVYKATIIKGFGDKAWKELICLRCNK